jgi:carbon starvation protein
MNVLTLLASGYAALVAGYAVLGRSIRRVVEPDGQRPTPATKRDDGVDYVPTRPVVLFGHHYMSIAGTSPIIASIVGLIWGWLPAALWMVLGVVLLGGVHDYYALMTSVRNEARSMGDVVRERLGPASGVMASLVLALGGILVYAIFLSVIVDTLVSTPTAAFPTLALIPIAVACGLLLRRGLPLWAITVIGVALVAICTWVGVVHLPIALGKWAWCAIFVGYTFAAIYSPVWVLLQPRDYLNSSVLAMALVLGLAGLVVGRPSLQMPAFVGFTTERGPLWPMLFVTISCGAASGWHSLIASGTTSKQLRDERHAFPIAYGGMQGETVLALLSLAMIAAAYGYDDFREQVYGGSVQVGAAFATALGKAMGHLGIPEAVGATIGALALAALTLTTLDSFARTGRYVVQELGGRTPLGKPLVASLFVTIGGFLLYATIPFMDLWNGLVLGGLLLLILPFAVLLVRRREQGRKVDGSFLLHVGLPLLFLVPTTLAGLGYLLFKYVGIPLQDPAIGAGGVKWISAALVLFLLVLLVTLGVDVTRRLTAPARPR